jgi:tungstate transport system substrate-binding protein
MNTKALLSKIVFSLIAMTLVTGLMAYSTASPVLIQKQADDQTAESPELVTIKLATTTSVDNSGLLAYLLPIFTGETNIGVDVIAVGTGRALELGQAGDVDVVLVHDQEAEEEFIAEGYGLERHYVAENEFVIVGPESDPAGIKDLPSVTDAFKAIMDTETIFVSRGDESGTHKREQALWAEAELTPEGEWYVQAGQGMGAVLTMTDEMQGYTLTDTGTFYSMEDNLDLVILYSGDELLKNIYSIIPLNPDLYPDLHHDEVAIFIDWLTGPEGRELIGGFEVNGHVLFEVREDDL